MSRVRAAIEAAKRDRGGALVGYLPIGFPDLATSVDAAVALVDNGADVLELGLPYSDPVMDGPVIQAATQRALTNGFRVRDTFAAVAAVARRVTAPVLVMTYWNPVYQFGVDRFAAELAAAGGAGLITPDITPESASDWIAASDEHGLDRVFLAAPTSSDERLRAVASVSRGFVYEVSTMGITGLRTEVDRAARALHDRIARASADAGSSEPICVGIGISTPEHVAGVLEYADGAIVGSALVRALADGGIPALSSLAASLAAGARGQTDAPIG